MQPPTVCRYADLQRNDGTVNIDRRSIVIERRAINLARSRMEAITEPTLRQLLEMHAGWAVQVVGVPRGFSISVKSSNGIAKTLSTMRGDMRRFASIDTAGSFLKGLGILSFSVEMSGHEPGRLRGARPDRALALRKTRTRPQQQELV